VNELSSQVKSSFRSTFERLPYGCLLFMYRLDLCTSTVRTGICGRVSCERDHSPHTRHRPHRPWQTPHAPSPPSCRSPRARTTARALLASSASIPITVSRCIVVSLYLVVSRCIVVSLYLRVSRRPVVSLCRCISFVLLYRCIVVYLLVSRCPVVSLCRCISPSRCIVVSLYNVRPT
jgi:hypothetical protein